MMLYGAAMKRQTLIALILVGSACGTKADKKPQVPAVAPQVPAVAPPITPATQPENASSAVDIAGMNTQAKPGDDFFTFANGGWLKSTEIPADRSSYGTFAMLAERTSKRVVDLITDATAQAAPGSEAQKVGDYYASFLAQNEIEAKGLAPLQPTLDKIAAITVTTLPDALGDMVRADVDALNNTQYETSNVMGLWVAQDLNDPSRYVPFLLQGGLSLPASDYYLSNTPDKIALRAAFNAHLVTMFKLAGLTEPEVRAKRVFALEQVIAKTHVSAPESMDVSKGNNAWKRNQFAKRAPGLNWERFFTAMGLPSQQQDFVVWHPSAVTGLAALSKSQTLQAWKDYLTYHSIIDAASVLPTAIDTESFAFYGTTLNGTPKMRDRWKRAVASTNSALGEAVGKLYVAKYFSAAEKARAETMVSNIIAAFGKRVDQLTWMSAATKAKAHAKLAIIKVSVGYPNTWRDYSELSVVRGDALGNMQRASLFERKRNLAKLGKPVNRDEWVMDAHLVNAVNLPVMNAMNFPAAILQPPYFDPTRPVVMDYGATGATIGHEISHSFDHTGALFDSNGKLQNWWTEQDKAQFDKAAAQLVAQYSSYKPLPDMSVDGKLTLDENISDLVGLAVAYDAYRLAYDGKPAPTVAGFTGDQQFFLSYAQSWRGMEREASLRRSLEGDAHAPEAYRAVTVRNHDAWYEAFQIRPGDKLYLDPQARVRIW
jgi:putative endopeptidase